jgi:hypothetical protein
MSDREAVAAELRDFVEGLWVAAVQTSDEHVALSGSGIKRSTFRPRLSPLGRLGMLFVVMMVLVIGAVIAASQTSAPTRVSAGPRPRPPAKASTPIPQGVASGAVSGSQAGASATSGGGSSSDAFSGIPDIPGSTAEAPLGLRQGTAAAVGAVTAAVPATPGLTIEQVLFAESDPSWGVEYLDSGPGTPVQLILVNDAGGWVTVESGPPPLGCPAGIPAAVASDLASVIVPC